MNNFESLLRDPDTWWAADEISSRTLQQTLQRFQKRLDRENAHAERFLSGILDSQYRFAYANIARRRRAQTGGVVRLLTQRARDLADQDPRFAVELADNACVIADALPDDYYPAKAVYELRGTAWKEYALACRYRGWLVQGLNALDRAERAYRHLHESTLAVATVNAVRAQIIWEQGRYDDALAYCRLALDAFRRRHEVNSYAMAKQIEAQILHRQGHVKLARDAYLEVFNSAEKRNDDAAKARAARNLAVAFTDLGDPQTAKDYLAIALRIFVDSGDAAMVSHTRWAIYWTALVMGDAADAAEHLPTVIEELTTFGFAVDAALAQLDLAEAHFVLGRYEEAAAACGALGAFFRQANMLSGALTAAAFLKEAANALLQQARGEHTRGRADGRLSTQPLARNHFTRVRKYLKELQLSPDLPFLP
ncbi:MAG: hypothetical protein ACTHQM_24290 [Thermoanaerobaculia bacterium]